MNRTTLLAAVAIALLGAVLFAVRKRRYVDEVTGGEMIGVLRVVDDIESGEPIFHTQLRVEYRPAAYVERRHVGLEDALTVVGRRTATDVRAGSTLVWTDIARGDESLDSDIPVSTTIPERRRAVTIKIESYAFSGLLNPGDRVDVFFTAIRGGGGVETTVLLAQNVSIISDISRRTGNDEGEKRWARSVTLSTTPEQATAIKHASREGEIAFAVRGRDDSRITEELPFITHADLIEPDDLIPVRRRVPRPPPAQTIERIN
ncbi:MAG: Flp pilus assembly protein CpaB [Myxococcota bacterium]